MSNNWNIEVSPELYNHLIELFEIFGLSIPHKITHSEMEHLVKHLKAIVKTKDVMSKYKLFDNKIKPETKLKALNKVSKALIISDVGSIRYHLRYLLGNHQIESSISESLYAGLAEYVKKLHEIVIIDISNKDKDVIEIIDEINRISRINAIKTRIILLIPDNKNCEILRYKSKGVDKYIEKQVSLNWYSELANYLTKLQIYR